MSDDTTTRGASGSGNPDPAHVPTPLAPSAPPRRPATPVDDALLIALVSGDEPALTYAWQTLFGLAHRFACVLCRGDRWARACTAEDIAAIAAERFYEAVRQGRVTHSNPTGMLYRIVRNTIIDFYRHERIAPAATAAQDTALRNVADTAADPEQAMLADERIRQRVRAWYEWWHTMLALCAKRPPLRRMLMQMHEYLRIELGCVQPPASNPGAATVRQLVETADMTRLTLSFESLNEFFQARGETRNGVDQGWKYLKEIAEAHAVTVPAGLTTRRRTAGPVKPALA
jgi:DNA-directed RNA polymerase specialized sigma24 family protein